MEWLNYHHLLYFWLVAKEGSIARASRELRLAHPTVSGQIHRLEEVLGEKLFARKGRQLVLTEVGRVAYRYADEIFSLGREFMDSLKGRGTGRPVRLVVGSSDTLSKSIVRRILEPAFQFGQPLRLVCREDRATEGFLADLAAFELDLVLSDAPAGLGSSVRAYNHPLGDCGTTFLAARALAARTRRGFPRSLDGAPFLLPGSSSALRRSLEQWFTSLDVRPAVVAELDDASLLTAFGEAGTGVFAVPTVIEDEVRKRHAVQVVGRVEALRQHFYAITVARKIRHPAVVAICDSARNELFGTAPGEP